MPPPSAISVSRQLALLVAAALAPVLLLLATFTVQLVRDEEALRGQQLQHEAQHLASQVSARIIGVVSKLQVLGRSASLGEGDFGQFYALSREVLAADDSLSNLLLVGTDGQHLVNLRVPYGTPLPPLNRPDLPRRAAAARSPIVSGFEQGAVLGRPLTVVYVPVVQGERVVYVIGAALETGQWDLVLRKNSSRGMHSVLLDEDGRMISATDGRADAPLKLVGSELAKADGSGSLFLAGVPARLQRVSRTADFAKWTVLSYIPPAEARSLVLPYTFWVFAAVALATAVALAVSARVGWRTGTAIRMLVDSVRKVAAGGEPAPIPTRIREIRDAQAALNDAAGVLAARVQEATAATAELRQINESRMDFLAALGHELRSPLGAIRNAVHVAERTRDETRLAWAIRVVGSQSAQMARLVDDLFDTSGVERRKLALSLEEVELGDLVRRVTEDFHEEFQRRQLTLECEVVEVVIMGDRTRLMQVLSNLLHNAAKFTPPGGKVSVALEAAGSHARLRVSDTGSGIAPDVLPGIFRPFIQGPRRSADGGLGLGLALVHGLVQLHGGRIVAESRGEGQGATFTVTMPAAGRAAAS